MSSTEIHISALKYVGTDDGNNKQSLHVGFLLSMWAFVRRSAPASWKRILIRINLFIRAATYVDCRVRIAGTRFPHKVVIGVSRD